MVFNLSENSSKKIDIMEIMKCLPHRFPFLLVDKVVDLIPNERIIGIKNVTINEPFFTGHFPQRPIMPGVLIVEAMAQVSGILALKTSNEEIPKDTLFLFLTIEEAKFRIPVIPGDVMEIHSKILKIRGDISRFECEVFVEGRRVANAIIAAKVIKPN